MIRPYFIAITTQNDEAKDEEKVYHFAVDFEPTREVSNWQEVLGQTRDHRGLLTPNRTRDLNGLLNPQQREWLDANMKDDWAATYLPIQGTLRFVALFASERDALLFHIFWNG